MTSSVDSHTIPSFYACYLLRSYATASSSRTYIGSTPDPVRRKKQHNGILTQGAHKTMRGRPWETQMIVWGFPSKIAALQFEWHWQKPYLSRHLKTHGPSSSAEQHVPLPLFTDTPITQVAVSADGCKALACKSVQSNLLVARALLRSEPFSTWNLRITFFEEYCWAAWLKLESDLSREVSLYTNRERYQAVGLLDKKSRLGRPLPPSHLTPAPICDFSGVDGTKKSLLLLNEAEKTALKLGEKRSKGVQEGRSPGQWPEKLPKTLTVKAMGATWDTLRKAPMAAVLREADQEGDYPRMKLNDDDQAEATWRRYQSLLESKGLDMNDVRTSSKPSSSTTHQCDLCKDDIALQQHLTYTTCPSPCTQLQPRSATLSSATLSQYGFGSNQHDPAAESQSTLMNDSYCPALFHIQCLARHYTEQQSSEEKAFLLPSHGRCPCCGVDGKEEHLNIWIEVIRGVFRRAERLEKEIVKAELARAKEEKMMLKAATKKRASPATKTSMTTAAVEVLPKRAGLLGALDEIQNRPKGKRGSQQVSKLMRDPIHSPPPAAMPASSIATVPAAPIVTTAKRSSLLCNLDSLLNIPSQESAAARSMTKRPKAATQLRDFDIIDLT